MWPSRISSGYGAMISALDMVQAGRDAVALQVKYIFGAKPYKHEFIRYSREEIMQLKNSYPDMVWDSDLDKAGDFCCDCSGLISKATGYVLNSQALFDSALQGIPVDKLAENWALYVGWVLWLPGHVGIVSDRPNFYYAMDGSARNAVHLPLNYNHWQYALKIPGVDYEVNEMLTDKDVERIADAVWLKMINGVRACDRLQGIDDYMPDRASDAVWLKEINGIKACDRLQGIDDYMPDRVAERIRK